MSTPAVRVEDIAEIRSGVGFPLKYQGRPAGDYGFAKVGDISCVARSGRSVIREAAHYVTEEDLPKMRARPFPPNSIVFAKIGEAIRQNFRVITEAPMCFDNNVMGLVPNIDMVEPRYLYYCLKPVDFYSLVNTTAVPSLRRGDIGRISIPLPPLDEQRRIAAILDKADAIRRKRREAIALTEELLRSTFLEMFGDPVTNPKGWPTVTLGKLASGNIRNGLSPSSRGVFEGRVLTLSAITQGAFEPAHQKAAMFDADMPSDKLVRADDLLVCRGNGNLGLVGCGRFPDRDRLDTLFPDTMIGVPINLTKVSKAYLEYAWNAAGARSQIEKNARTTNGTHKVNQSVLRSIELQLPPLGLQQDFQMLADRLAQLGRGLRSDDIDDLFHSLVQRAFRGEL